MFLDIVPLRFHIRLPKVFLLEYLTLCCSAYHFSKYLLAFPFWNHDFLQSSANLCNQSVVASQSVYAQGNVCILFTLFLNYF